MEAVLKILNSYSVLLMLGSVMIIAFARTIIRIFRMGATFKTEFATRKEMAEFQAEVRKDMRAYTVQIQKIVTDSVMTVLNNKMKDIEDSKEAVTDIKVMKAEIQEKINYAMERLDEMKIVADSVRTLGNKVSRLEQQYLTSAPAGERRHE